MKPIDLRSDTVTNPSPEMRRAMADAEVGDDWYGDDPTVNRLQDRCAEITGKDAAVYVATGTMANQIALHVFVRSGHTVVTEASSHVATTEVTSSATMSGISFAGIRAPEGRLTADLVEPAIRPDPYGVDVIDLVTVENTHQVGGGTVLPVEDLRGIRKATEARGLPLYMDGARLFNASVASGTPVREFTDQVDAVMFCLSKGLGAPIGSVLCGPREFVEEGRRAKILFGGAWRQAGIMAAAGLVALETGPGRLHEDHANARRLAEGISRVSPGAVDPTRVETNIVFVDTRGVGLDPWLAWERLRDEEGVLSNVVAGKVRLVTHLDVTGDDVEGTIDAWRRVTGAAVEGEQQA
jgi:threonine aldolase